MPFYGDGCTEDCYILSGYVYDDSTTLPSKNVSIELMGADGIFFKTVAITNSNDSGYWKISFDADYIEDLSSGRLQFRKNDYLWRDKSISFNKSDINIEQSHTTTIHKAGYVHYKMHISQEEVKRVRAIYDFEGKTRTLDLSTSQHKPLIEDLRTTIPAYYNIGITLYYSKTSNLGNNTDWTYIEGSTVNANVGFMEIDTVHIIF